MFRATGFKILGLRPSRSLALKGLQVKMQVVVNPQKARDLKISHPLQP